MNNLILPPRHIRTNGGSYGAIEIARRYCKASGWFIPQKMEWQHGWLSTEYNQHPESVVGTDGNSRSRKNNWKFLVARLDQANYLRTEGYKDVQEVGLPIIYVDPPPLERIDGSLLVMPRHTAATSAVDWSTDEYANYIRSIAPRFTRVAICVHRSCYDKGRWDGMFEGTNVELVLGSDEEDQNSLLRMAMLMSQFEYLTSNALGSHIAYGSYYGCKVSVAGPLHKFDLGELKNVTFYRNAPELIELYEEWERSDFLKQKYSRFFCVPWEAKQHIDWAAWELGADCKKNPQELRKLLGWTARGAFLHFLRKVKSRILKSGISIYNWLMILRSLGFSGFIANAQISGSRYALPGTITSVRLRNSRVLSLRNGSSDFDVFEQHFIRREILSIKFPLSNVATIIDLGANIGVSVAVFRQMFPQARIIAVELEENNSKLCSLNHRDDSLVEVVTGAIWSHTGRVGMKDVGEGEWAFRVETDQSSEDDNNSVPAFTYRELLNLYSITRVDIMKMDIEGAEADVLEASADDIFSSTAIVILEVHEWIEGIEARVSKVLESVKRKYLLDISRSGEFLMITNRALL